MKIISIVGARPNFIKMMPIVEVFNKSKHEHILVHTGQHYDINMSDVFFKEMDVKSADYNLRVGSALHGEQTGEILKRTEEVILKEKPDIVVVPGDTNSTLGGALAAVKLHVKVAHLEAGLRSFNRRMPEEINRILTDHCSDFLFCPTQIAIENLKKEGIKDGVYYVGDTMFEIAHLVEDKVDAVPKRTDIPNNYILATIHRAENTTSERLPTIMQNLGALKHQVVLPLHPRTKKKLEELGKLDIFSEKISFIEPIGFFEFTKLLKEAKAVITDSGGVQKEAYWHKIPCVTVREQTEWLETIEAGGNVLAEPSEIKEKVELMTTKKIKFDDKLYGFTDTSKRILDIFESEITK
ncbi:MAG: UDP-N-acetylglucosamine 2-epimerase (non-hydrolyzing) [Candidatus Heimdallarchaeota archaeon]|nr:UDP-N-acetylglucosamine 2-epimerase (non-hydrolyzing) [Candidatus Heimdallarchaeota archaeon]MBY8995187.1 UDP-N-acetylglucosamine 2-epimerase (non-hydrolyzing) [Candidatus Heimdallarchaeota archaeon]